MVFPTAIGTHRASRENDVISIKFAGPLTLEQLKVLRDQMDLVRGEYGHCYLLVDAADLAGITAEARKTASDWGRTDPDDHITGIGVYGINFAMRALSVLTLAAVKFMTRRRPLMVHFASDAAEARAWIAGRRTIDTGNA